jgi:hypothetical protein
MVIGASDASCSSRKRKGSHGSGPSRHGFRSTRMIGATTREDAMAAFKAASMSALCH